MVILSKPLIYDSNASNSDKAVAISGRMRLNMLKWYLPIHEQNGTASTDIIALKNALSYTL